VLSGSGRVKLDDEILEIETHDAIRVAPSVTRAWEAGADGLELLAFGPRHEDDGEVVLDWWTGAIAPVDTPAGSAVRTECWRA